MPHHLHIGSHLAYFFFNYFYNDKYWDEEIAKVAQHFASACDLSRSHDANRRVPGMYHPTPPAREIACKDLHLYPIAIPFTM